jgi:DNA invertase Pin-like site-specific DNA recombinase
MISAMAEDERLRIIKRTHEGRQIGRQRGVWMGRRPRLNARHSYRKSEGDLLGASSLRSLQIYSASAVPRFYARDSETLHVRKLGCTKAYH